MKYFFSILCLVIFSVVHAQQLMITVSAGNKNITVNLDDYNFDKTLLINPAKISATNACLTIKVFNEVIDTSWDRFFMIYDTANTEIATLKSTNEDTYTTELAGLISSMKKNENYFVYTIIKPKDLQRQMLVKVARSMICKIKLSS